MKWLVQRENLSRYFYAECLWKFSFHSLNLQVHKRSDECIHAHNLLEMIHAGKFLPNLFNDTSILQELKVNARPVCGYFGVGMIMRQQQM